MLSKVIDPNGSVVKITYDSADRLIRKDITRASGVEGTTFEVYNYDGAHRMIKAQDDDSVVEMKYDSLGNITQESQTLSGAPTRNVLSQYDLLGNRTKLTYPSGKEINFTYDGLYRLKTISQNLKLIAEYSYIGPGRVKSRRYGLLPRLQ